MKKLLVALFIVGWFFAYRIPASPDGPQVRTVVGPFLSEPVCRSFLDNVKDMFEALGIKAEMPEKCVEKEGA